MGFAQAAFPVNEQGIKGKPSGGLCNFDGHGVGHAVRFPDNEVLEREGRRGIRSPLGDRLLGERCGRGRRVVIDHDVLYEGMSDHAGWFEGGRLRQGSTIGR